MIEVIVSTIIGWLTNRVADKSVAEADRILTGDAQAKTLRNVVHDAIEEITRDSSVADGEVLRSALLVESPALEPLVPRNILDLPVELRMKIQPRLEALASQGYDYDADQLVGLLCDAIGKGIEANAAQEGSHLALLAETLRDRGILDELKSHRPSPQHVFDYTQTVSRFAPTVLRDREAELAKLREFCLRPSGESYSYWRGTAWAGKTALLATFVLAPFMSEVTFVPFFIRAGDQDDYQDFLRVVTRQLGVILGENPPWNPSHADLDSMLGKAAEKCQQEGRRLVLVVDGLDEDWYASRTKPRRRPSIASLLPQRPPSGMRVIVSGRPDPPVPDDVSDGHPLLDPGVVQELAPSSHAKLSERRAKRDLTDMLEESELSRQLLGLIVAAETGLSIQCLAELTRKERWEVERRLGTVSGRVLHRLGKDSWTARDREGGYQLAHTDLRELARDLLGKDLGKHRRRIFIWAEEYRGLGWPPETPEYLLRGYFRMLDDLGDLPRMIENASDITRHDRMLGLSGGDAAPLYEVRTALDRIAAQDDPDLASALALACHRSQLTNRNTDIPEELPAVWAALGQMPRAEALARSITAHQWYNQEARALILIVEATARAGQYAQAEAIARSITDELHQARALAKVSGGLARAGQYAQAEAIARAVLNFKADALAEIARELARAGQHRQAEALARSITSRFLVEGAPAEALTEVAAELAQTGQREQAEALARSIWGAHDQFVALAEVAGRLVRAGQTEQAEALARSIPGAPQARALAKVAGELARAGQHARAEAIAAQALAAARRFVITMDGEARTLATVAAELGRAGQHAQAEAIAAQALAAARSVTRREDREGALAEVAETLSQAGQQEQAVAAARSITSQYRQSLAVAAVAGGLAQAGQHAQAADVARSITQPKSQASALAKVAWTLAQEGQYAQAEAIAAQAETAARSVATSPESRASDLARIAVGLARAGQHAQARAFAAQAETAARSTPHPDVLALQDVVRALAHSGQHTQAEAVARSITDPIYQSWALTEIAEGLARAGQQDLAVAMARTMGKPYLQQRILAAVAGELARTGHPEQAVEVSGSITDPHYQARVLADFAEVLARAGQQEKAAAFVAQALAAARSITSARSRENALAEVAGALAMVGQREQAVALARSIEEPRHQEKALAAVAGGLVWAGQSEQAMAVARSCGFLRAPVLAEIAEAMARTGQHARAEAIARSVTDPFHGGAALAKVAEALAEVGEVHSAARVAAALCASSTETWRTAVVPVLLLAPTAITTLARILEEQ